MGCDIEIFAAFNDIVGIVPVGAALQVPFTSGLYKHG
jgi:hypothetical protein